MASRARLLSPLKQGEHFINAQSHSPSTTSFLLVVGSDWSSKAGRFFLIEYMAGGIGFGVPGLSLVVVECPLFDFFHIGEPYSLACLVAN